MYGEKNKSLATPADVQAPVITPKANRGTAPIDKVPQNDTPVKSSNRGDGENDTDGVVIDHRIKTSINSSLSNRFLRPVYHEKLPHKTEITTDDLPFTVISVWRNTSFF